jgi:hypothetical protein
LVVAVEEIIAPSILKRDDSLAVTFHSPTAWPEPAAPLETAPGDLLSLGTAS